ncbi:MAG: glycosyltransferase family 4 protein [Anaerolineae bacterium]
MSDNTVMPARYWSQPQDSLLAALQSTPAGESKGDDRQRLEARSAHEVEIPKLRICLLTDCYPPSIGGIESHVYGLALQLGRLGHHVDVVTHQPVVPMATQQAAQVDPPEPPTNVVVHRLKGFVAHVHGADPVLDLRIISKVQNLLRAKDYDIVHGHSSGSILALAGLWAARQLGVPTLITRHSMVLRIIRPFLVSRLLLEGELWVVKKWVDGVIALSEGAAEELNAIDLPIYIIPGGVDCEHWHPDVIARKRSRGLLGYQEGDIVVGYLSRLVRSKGVMSLPKVATRIVRLVPDVRFLVIGDGPMRSQLEREIQELGLKNVVTILGSRPWWETPHYLNAMDVFVFPSYREAFGLALLEAMACGIAPVARINAGTRELITDGETGYLVASDEELSHKLLKLVQDEGLRNKIGVNARSNVQDKYSWSVTTERTVEAYREAIRRRTERSAQVF